MFPHHSNSSPVPKLFSQNANINNQNHSQISQKSLQIKMNHSRQSRQHKLSRMRQMNSMQSLKYEDMSFYKFFPLAEKETNPFTILLTIFVIADNFSWRQYLPHLEILIKKFTNMVQCSRGKILQELSNKNALKTKLGGYSFQERFETMLHLSNKQFQQHLLILIHALIAYNKRYCLLDQALLSDHLTFKHSYEKEIRQQVLWLLTRMSVSGQSFNKIIKNLLMNPQNSSCLLPTLTIIANFIYQQPDHIIQQIISSPEFYNALGRGLISSNYQTQRQSVFICNNIVFKSQACCNFILSQSNLVNQIQKLNNQEVIVFKTVLQGMLSDKNVSVMNEENTS